MPVRSTICTFTWAPPRVAAIHANPPPIAERLHVPPPSLLIDSLVSSYLYFPSIELRYIALYFGIVCKFHSKITMNSSVIVSDIRYILQGLEDSNPVTIRRELFECAGYGKDGSVLLLKTCLAQMNLGSGDVQRMSLKPEVVAAIFRHLLTQTNFSSVLCGAFENMEINEMFLLEFSDPLQLSVPEKICLGLALAESENLNIRENGENFCMHEIKKLAEKISYIESADEIQRIILFYYKCESLVKNIGSFKRMFSMVDLKEDNTYVLLPLLWDDTHDINLSRNMDLFYGSRESEFDSILAEMQSEASIGDFMGELGYGCTSDISHCKELLSFFLPLTEVTVARILGTIFCTDSVLGDSQSLYSTFLSALGVSATADSSCQGSWNIDVLVDSINELAPRMNWIHVMENLDHEGFFIRDADSFTFFMSLYSRACQVPFPLHSICGSIWKNIEGQLSFLQYAVLSPPQVFTFAHSSRKVGGSDPIDMDEDSISQSNYAWSSLDLLDLLCRVAERGHACAVRTMLALPLEHCPEILLLGIAQINTTYNLLQNEVSNTVLPMVVGKATKGVGVIHHLWHSNPELVVRGFVDIMIADRGCMLSILQICEELKILPMLLEKIPFYFGIHLAVLAYQKDCMDLEKWLGDNLCDYRDVFFEECFNFLKGLSADASGGLAGNPRAYSDINSIFFKVLHANGEQLSSSHLYEEFRRLHLHLQPVPVVSSQEDNRVSRSRSSNQFDNDIEADANSHFHQLFSGQLTVDAMAQMLTRFKESSDKREQSVFACMIDNLFEESKFFTKYPEKQLKIAASLLGAIIRHQLVTHIALGIALRFVLDGLRKPTDSKLFIFGITALEQFLDRLEEWPHYCNHIVRISHLRNADPKLVANVEQALARISGHLDYSVSNAADQHNLSAPAVSENLEMNLVFDSSWQILGSKALQSVQISSPLPPKQKSQSFLSDKGKLMMTSALHTKSLMPSGDSSVNLKHVQTTPNAPTLSSGGVLQSSRGSSSTRFGSALNIETLAAAAERRETQIEIPTSEVQDKILFMINNISSSNVEAKAKDFSDILSEQYYPWFSQYMVMKRASIEPNFHDLYFKFLDKVNSKSLNKEIVNAAYENCKVLLRSELIKSSSEERSLLKNLGSWLGKFTIGRNQVLRAREIDPKSLIVEAYEKGLMIALIPFTSKILEPCQHSIAYRPPNPWTVGILSLLAEIYALPNLKMNLKFDIEVLFKNLGVDMKEVKPTCLLKDRVREVEGNPDFSNKDAGVAQPQIAPEINSGIISTLNQVDMQADIVSPSRPSGHLNVVPQYPASVHLSSGQLTEEEKFAALSLSDRLPPGQGISQVAPSHSTYSAGQLPSVIPSIGNHVILNPKLNPLGLHFFQRVVPIAIERAIKDVTAPVVQRSVTIAMQTTKELVMKDYAMESDETRIYNAAHLMVASLAGSLAHVTCKEPLRTSISSQLRNSVQGPSDAIEILEAAIPLVVNDNLDLGCAAIEQSAMEKALQSIDVEIAQLLALRRKHREGVGPSYFDASMYTQGPMGMIPEALRPRPGHLSHSQQRVYEDFVRFPWQNQPGQSSNAVPSGAAASSVRSATSGISRGYTPSPGRPNNTLFSSGIGGGGLNTVSESLDFTPETDSSPAQILSSSSRVGFGGSINPSKINSPGSYTPPVLSSAEETTMVAKELMGNAIVSTSSVPEQLTSLTEQMFNTGYVLEEYENIAQQLKDLIITDAGDAEIQRAISLIPDIILKCVSRDEAGLAVAQKVFRRLYDHPSDESHVSMHLMLLTAIRDVCKLVGKQLTTWVVYSEEERRYDVSITVGLIRRNLINLAEYNVQMAKLLDGGRNIPATNFAISLLEFLLLQESRAIVSELPTLVDALAKIAAKPGSSESLQQLIEVAKNPNAPTLSAHSFGPDEKSNQPIKNKPLDRSSMVGDDGCTENVGDLSLLREQASVLFTEWYQIYDLHYTNDAACTHFISQLQQNGFLDGDESSDNFFRLLTELSVAHCFLSEGVGPTVLSVQSAHSDPITFVPVDVYAKLVSLVVKYCIVEAGPSKLSLFAKILSVTVTVIQRETEEKKTSFNSRPYFRLFINWMFDLLSSDSIIDGTSFQVLVAFSNAFHALQPLKVPGFSFAWLELISHRTFMPKLLTTSPPKGWGYVQRLLVDLFKFMEPYLRNAELGKPIEFLYRGTLRVLLVLLHDFPEFLCDYHFSFCDVIPSSCIQMRNVILSAFPRNMRLPDPSTPNLKIDLLAEIVQSPQIFSDVDAALKAKQMKYDVDEYLKTRHQPSSFLSELKSKLLLQQSEAADAGTRYNVPLINSVVLYVGMQTIPQLQAKTPPLGQPMAPNGPMELYSMGAALDIFQTLIVELDTEGRYLFLNAIANQLRYPNNHTHFFSFALLYLFVEANQEIIQEQITRVLLERLIVNRPHPWGLLITFIELIKNTRYNFWSRSFTRCAPEIEKLFDSVSRSCGGPKPGDDSISSGGLSDMH